MAGMLLGLGVLGGVAVDRLSVEAASATTAAVERSGTATSMSCRPRSTVPRFRVALLEARSELLGTDG